MANGSPPDRTRRPPRLNAFGGLRLAGVLLVAAISGLVFLIPPTRLGRDWTSLVLAGLALAGLAWTGYVLTRR